MHMRESAFEKYENGPVFGNRETGTMFDAYVWKDKGRFRMDVSWRMKKALAVTFSDDGIHFFPLKEKNKKIHKDIDILTDSC